MYEIRYGNFTDTVRNDVELDKAVQDLLERGADMKEIRITILEKS